jgi:hypothetical protein
MVIVYLFCIGLNNALNNERHFRRPNKLREWLDIIVSYPLIWLDIPEPMIVI